MHLVDYKIYSYGQDFEDDLFNEVVSKMSKAILSLLVLHFICIVCLELFVILWFYENVSETLLEDKDMYFVFQGYTPTQ